jgi:hypothetical protein
VAPHAFSDSLCRDSEYFDVTLWIAVVCIGAVLGLVRARWSAPPPYVPTRPPRTRVGLA